MLPPRPVTQSWKHSPMVETSSQQGAPSTKAWKIQSECFFLEVKTTVLTKFRNWWECNRFENNATRVNNWMGCYMECYKRGHLRLFTYHATLKLPYRPSLIGTEAFSKYCYENGVPNILTVIDLNLRDYTTLVFHVCILVVLVHGLGFSSYHHRPLHRDTHVLENRCG